MLFFPKALRCEGSLVKKRLPCVHHYTYTAHLHATTLTPLTYTAPQHLHTSHHLHRSHTLRHSICTHRTTYTAHTTTLTPLTYTYTAPQHLHTSPSHRLLLSLFLKAGVGSSGIVGARPLRVSCASHRSRCGAVRTCKLNSEPSSRASHRSRCDAVRSSKLNSEPSAGFVRVASLPLWRRAKF